MFLLLINFFSQNFDIISELLTPDKNAFFAFIYGAAGGLLGTRIRNSGISDAKPNSKKEGIGHYAIWAAFGSLVALTISGIPFSFFFSLFIGIFAPAAYKLMEKKIPDFVSGLFDKLPAKKNEKES